MAQHHVNQLSERAKALQVAIADLLAFVPADAESIETLDLDLLAKLASGGEAKYPGVCSTGATTKLRAYLHSLDGFMVAYAAGDSIPGAAHQAHIHAAMQLLSGTQSNLEALGASQSIVIASILPVSPTDAELCGRG